MALVSSNVDFVRMWCGRWRFIQRRRVLLTVGYFCSFRKGDFDSNTTCIMVTWCVASDATRADLIVGLLELRNHNYLVMQNKAACIDSLSMSLVVVVVRALRVNHPG